MKNSAECRTTDMLNKIWSAILNIVMVIPEEQRAVVSHVMSINTTHPEMFQHIKGGWYGDELGITYTPQNKVVVLSGVTYTLGRMANAILGKSFRNNHLLHHHYQVSELLSEKYDEGDKKVEVVVMNDEAAHWKANHDNVVERLRLLLQRKDLPVDRIDAYNRLVWLQERNQYLEGLLKERFNESKHQ